MLSLLGLQDSKYSTFAADHYSVTRMIKMFFFDWSTQYLHVENWVLAKVPILVRSANVNSRQSLC